MAHCPRSTQLFQRIEKANELLERCSNLDKSIDGLSKLKRKIVAELKFLKSLESIPEPFQASYIKSTNLSFFEAVLVNCEQEKDVVAVIKPFCYVDINSDKFTFVVDVVADNGYCWIKVTARNASALHWIWQGGGDFGDKDIYHQTKVICFKALRNSHISIFHLLALAEVLCKRFSSIWDEKKYIGLIVEMLQETSKQHPWNFSPPHVMLFCYNGITESLAKAFTSIGINVKGKLLTDPGKELTSSGIDESFVVDRPHTQQCNLVNLDITTMIALVSALTNGGCGYVFKEPILTEQAKQERKSPVLPKVKLFLQGKELFACQTAVRDFNTILKTVGGVKEQERARDLLDTVTIVDDNPSTRSSGLQLSATIKKRSKVIFGTGDSMKAITSTANVSFTRAAANQGVEFSVFIHDSRALTESKEGQATLVEDLV